MYILPDSKIPDYAIHLSRLVALLAQDHNGVAPRNQDDVAHVKALLELLKVDRKTIDLPAARKALHTLLWPIVCRSGTANKFDHILEMYYPLTSLRDSGNYNEPKNTTGLFGHMKYIMRMAWCYEGIQLAQQSGDSLYE